MKTKDKEDENEKLQGKVIHTNNLKNIAIIGPKFIVCVFLDEGVINSLENNLIASLNG